MGNIESHSEEGIPMKQDNTQQQQQQGQQQGQEQTKEQQINQQEGIIENETLQVIMTGEAENFRVYAHQDSSTQLSMWHDIKLFPEKDSKKKKIVNMVCEIPKCSRKKYEIATKEPGNPIKQDIKKGKLREFARVRKFFLFFLFIH